MGTTDRRGRTTTSGWGRKRTTRATLARAAKYASPAHRAARKRYARDVAAGIAACWRCGRGIPPDTDPRDWHVGHDDHDTDLIRGPEHKRCNLEAAARKGARIRNAPARTPLAW